MEDVLETKLDGLSHHKRDFTELQRDIYIATKAVVSIMDSLKENLTLDTLLYNIKETE